MIWLPTGTIEIHSGWNLSPHHRNPAQPVPDDPRFETFLDAWDTWKATVPPALIREDPRALMRYLALSDRDQVLSGWN